MVMFDNIEQACFMLQDKVDIAEIVHFNRLLAEENTSNRIQSFITSTGLILFMVFCVGWIDWKDYAYSIPILLSYLLIYTLNILCSKAIHYRMNMMYFDFKRELARKYLLRVNGIDELDQDQLKEIVQTYICPIIDMELNMSE